MYIAASGIPTHGVGLISPPQHHDNLFDRGSAQLIYE